MRTGDDEDEIRSHLTQLARELQPLPAPPPMAPLIETQSPSAQLEDEVVFVKERRVERCRCGVVGKAVCEKDIASFEGCVEGGEECRRERAHADDLMAAGVKWCRTFLVTGISAGRSVL